MEQEKIGKFIASCRKEQGFTQAVLAEKLGITDRAVSKWETGRSLPDAAIMPELCDLLKINLSELFSGERIAMENYKETSDALLLEMKKQEESSNKRILHAAVAAQAMWQGIRPEKTAADTRRGAATKPQSTEAPISTRQETKSAVRACLSAMRMQPTLCIS